MSLKIKRLTSRQFICSLLLCASMVQAKNEPSVPVFKRDPFTTSDKMFAQQMTNSSQRPGGGFMPGLNQGLPKMKLRGFLSKMRGKATALLEVEGAGVYMVSRGDEIGLNAIGMNTVLKVIDVTANGVKVQSGQINQVVIVR